MEVIYSSSAQDYAPSDDKLSQARRREEGEFDIMSGRNQHIKPEHFHKLISEWKMYFHKNRGDCDCVLR